MADGHQTHDASELWGKVEGLEKFSAALDNTVSKLGVQVTEGFNQVFRAIQESHDKTDHRIENLSKDTERRFEGQNNSNQQSAAQRAATTLTVVGILTSSIIGIGGLAATIITGVFAFYTLTKAPIDDQFKQVDRQTMENKQDIKDLTKNTVPKAQVDDIEETAKENSKTITQQGKDIADIKAHQEDVLKTLRALPQVYATIDYTKSLDNRSTLLSQRLQTIYDKNFATPAIPCIGSGCAAHSAPTNGPPIGNSKSE